MISFCKQARLLAFALAIIMIGSQALRAEVLRLESAIEIALENNYDIKVKQASLPLAEAELLKARYRPNPYVSGAYEFVNSGSIHPLDIGLEIELGKKRYWRIRAAKTEEEINEQELAKIVWDSRISIKKSYTKLAIAQKFLDLAEKRKIFYSKLFSAVEARYSVGDVSKLDLLRAKVEYLTSENDLYEFQEKFNDSQKDFILGLGFNPQSIGPFALVDIEEDKEVFKIKAKDLPAVESLQTTALTNRFENKILTTENQKLDFLLNEAKWSKLTNLKIEGGAVTTTGAWGPYAGFQMDLPFFTNSKAEIKTLKTNLDQQKVLREQQEFKIKTEVSRALELVKIKEAQLERFKEEILDEVGQIFEMINEAYSKGKYSLTEVLVAEERNMDIQQRYLNSLQDYILSLTNFEEILGVELDDLG